MFQHYEYSRNLIQIKLTVIVGQFGKFEFLVNTHFWFWLLQFLCEAINISVGNFIRSMVEVWISIATVVLEKHSCQVN